MKTVQFLTRVSLFVLIGTSVLSCNNDEDSDDIPPVPETGYFVRTMKVTDGEDRLFFNITLEYDDNNRLVGETFVAKSGARKVG
ncbi:hypothetical protein [Sinomicrobium soli]|uniref:hypothetical protein n=1 Tax=Sinomicrobium sp. N-1-3-6 TaxID=2219864 RepID=UPI000DCF23BE|nr:hypothetical protein [Sinomicrobium sp. N-1-3-6]RAV28690.1 hypothetical protein DN748_12105 [Sinomicrobium sp. N-1-3-6]